MSIRSSGIGRETSSSREGRMDLPTRPQERPKRRTGWETRAPAAGLPVLLLLSLSLCGSCAPGARDSASRGEDAEVATRGSIEVTARLVEVPPGAIFKRDLYDYATVLKYQVVKVHRGRVEGETMYVGHYNPFKPRSEAADRHVKDVGGRLDEFRAGQVHRMALEPSIDDCYIGGIVNKYFDEHPEPIYWAVWTNRADED